MDNNTKEAPSNNEENTTKTEEVTTVKSGCCYNTKQFFLYDNSRKEIQAFYFNQCGRSVLFISFMFLSLAILQLANEEAGCPKDEKGNFTDCGNTVYGMDPSSMLALMAIVGGLATSCFMVSMLLLFSSCAFHVHTCFLFLFLCLCFDYTFSHMQGRLSTLQTND